MLVEVWAPLNDMRDETHDFECGFRTSLRET